MIIADTSAWVEYDRGTGSATHLALRSLVKTEPSELAVTEPVLMEVLAGARTEERSIKLERLLRSFEWIPADPVADFVGAAKLYRACRRAGTTPRSLTDCMIANIALRTGAQILAADRDFADIAKIAPLRLYG